jgi:hypothetical protein
MFNPNPLFAIPINVCLIFFPQDFMEATEAVSFYIQPFWPRDADKLQSFQLDNMKTQERLVMKMHKDEHNWDVTIMRFPIGVSKERIEEMKRGRGVRGINKKVIVLRALSAEEETDE